MKKRLIALLLLCSLLLSGCALIPADPTTAPTPAPSETAAPEPTPSPTPAPTPTPEPTPEPTPTPDPTLPPPVDPPEEGSLTATHAFVYDCGKGELLYWLGDQNEHIAPASLSKLLTCHVAMQYLDTNAVITAGEEVTWIEENASVAAVFQDYRLTVEMLVEGLMLQSGNDAAMALAVAAGRAIAEDETLDAQTALDTFMTELNRQAAELGLTDTYFLFPDGRDAEGHYSSPADLMEIALLAMDNPTVMAYGKVYRDYVVYESGQDYVWLNTNSLVNPNSDFYRENAVGLKTGTTANAGNCLLSVFEREGGLLLIGVFGCPEKADRYQDTLLLYEHYEDR